MQGKRQYFIADEDYKKFCDYVSAERKNYNNRMYCFERAMQNIFSMFAGICYPGSKSWALMLFDIAKETDIDELLRICNMRIAFDKPKIKC